MGVTELHAGNYESFVHPHAHVVIHFWADWNHYDDAVRDVIEQLAQDLTAVQFASFDTSPEENWAKCRDLQIKNLPTLVFYRRGERTKTLVRVANTPTKRRMLELITRCSFS
jgi:thiol-disulfide isomerase/thioredoxin